MELKHDIEIKDVKNVIEREIFAFNQMRKLDEFTDEYVDDCFSRWEGERKLILLQDIKNLEELQKPIDVGLVI